MDKVYRHQEVEEKWYRFWEESGFFTPKIDPKKKPFCIIMPPPNANGPLHIGHAMFVTIQDILTRYHRMLGEPTLWLPGADHAGILTQVVFEKELAKLGKTRFDLGQEEFYHQCYEFSQKNKQYMYSQLKRLGASCDWTREKFTLDPDIKEIVLATFKKLYQDGLVYKGERIINWCPRCTTALSDLEVEYQEQNDQLYFVSYGIIKIATTRPETILADVAVAVHPEDKRYKKLVGQEATLPILNKKIPIIADEAIDPKFGTGALKITPGHDPLDWEIGQRHKLAALVVIDTNGKMVDVPEGFLGLTTQEARKIIVEKLKEQGVLIKIEPYKHNVGACERCGTIIEPLISKQWFIKTKPLAEPAIKAVKSGEIKIVPRRFEKVYFNWMENIKDWCISRQIWWGYKIPIEGEEDTLDTWFSSGQWPFATLMANSQEDFDYFYPTQVLETGYEILFFWVARMIMLGFYRTGKAPFKTVYLHGLVRDAFGEKMSKSKGNVIDPLGVSQKYGADAVRMALIWGTSPGHDLNLGEEKIRGMRNFTNKVWNIGRFILLNLEGKKVPFYEEKMKGLTDKDQEILNDLNHLIKQTIQNLDNFRFSQAAGGIYEFLWHKFADIYIEYSKKRIADGDLTVLAVLRHVYLNCLKLLHPFMPFITEDLWSKFEKLKKEPLIISPWPKLD
ncbi:MAG: valyl-tRNA synthetase [Microgenomates group bacterium LiPW_16]|nr:MAG: valyl-tRNA synthetase [Microgenomates group bacterium LiPW_16]